MVARLKWVGWKGIGAVLTLAGAIVGLVVLILPTSAFGGPGCGGSTMRIFNFDPPSAKAGSNTVVTIYGANLKEAEDSVWVGPKGNQTPTSSFTYANNVITFTVPTGAVSGPIALASTSHNPGCMTFSQRSLRVG